MSLILEALKKSEAERRLGQAPTLATTTELASSRRVKRWHLFLLAVFALIAAFVAVAVLSMFLERPAPTARVDAASGSTSLGSITTAATPRPEAGSRPTRTVGSTVGPSAAVPAIPSDPAQVSTANSPAPSDRSVEDGAEQLLPRSVEFDSVERESTPVAATDLRDTASPTSGLESAPELRQTDTVATPGQAAAAAAQVDEPTTSMEGTKFEWVRVEYLPTQERGALPPLKVSMHVFADIPSARFVLIDGRRLIEGDRIDESLQVIEIRREGTVLEHKGRRLLLARP